MFGDRIADFLLDLGEVNLAQIEEARRTQSFFGGGLETHLLKLGFIDESLLGRALSDVTGAPYASSTQLLMIPLNARSAIPDELIRKHRFCPFNLDRKSISIAMLNPKDVLAVSAAEEATGLEVDIWVTSEYRLEKALERHYGIEANSRHGLTIEQIAGKRARKDSGLPGNSRILARESAMELGLDGLPLDAEITFDDQLFHHGGLTSFGEPGRSESTKEQAPGTLEDRLKNLNNTLSTALDRTTVADSLLDFCLTLTARCALFTVGKDGFRCVAGRGTGMESAEVMKTAVPHEEGSLFDTALSGGEFYLGSVPALPSNRDFYAVLGGRIPALVMILPIKVKKRTVALLYLDDDTRPMHPPDISMMVKVAAKAGLAFQILILRNKLLSI